MEKFMYLFRGGDAHKQGASPQALKALVQEMMTWMGDLSKKGLIAGGEPLQREGMQVSGTQKIVSDGPYIEAKEIVGGFVIVHAKDINEAVELAKTCPIVEGNGRIEVRPIQKMEM